MASTKEPISVRITRINNVILGQPQALAKINKNLAAALSREGLLDTLCLLYNECNKESLKKRDKNIYDFITKYRSVLNETSKLRVSSDDFDLKALIGKGYYGDVNLVAEKTTGDVYAMKKIKKSVVTSTQVKEERDIMARRSSEWITTLQYAFQDTDHLYLVMEYLPGGDLLSLMFRNGPFDEDLARFYLAELTLAINALHCMGYVHRDIKPENILIDRFGHIKLADFGNSACLNKNGHVTSMSPVGTPDYIAPELLQTISSFKPTKSVYNVSCDYWSMGIIGYELLYEVTPFHDENVHETYSKILSFTESKESEKIKYPEEGKISAIFKNLLESLITKAEYRITYLQVTEHPFFKTIDWDNLRQTVPPIIPNVSSDDDISNFVDTERFKAKRNTLLKNSDAKSMKANEFSGKDLPFLGYSFVHQENFNISSESNNMQINKLNLKIKELQKTLKRQLDEIKSMQDNLLKAEKKASRSDSLNKILSDAKEELHRMKDKLKEKTIELASCKTEVKTLKSSLKIEEEMRLKNDATISEVLGSTYQKWEKAKMLSDQNYEKQISEKKNEISKIAQKLSECENELQAKSEECSHLHDKIQNYKEMLKSIKEQCNIDKNEFEKVKTKISQSYEAQIKDLKNQLKNEKNSQTKLSDEMRSLKYELNETMCTNKTSQNAKILFEKNAENMKQRLNKEIEENKNLRSQNANLEKKNLDMQKTCENYKNEIDRLKTEQKLLECKQTFEDKVEISSPYRTAHGSLSDLQMIEETLRNDLKTAKENEDVQRKRAEQLEKAVAKLEDILSKLSEQPKSIGDILEKQNEKLEDKLIVVREQAVIERQAARAANLSLWKMEKKADDLENENKILQRRMELTEEKIKKIQNEKSDLERKVKEFENLILQKDEKIQELKCEINDLKLELKNEHTMWQNAEQERMKEKSEVIENISHINSLQEKIDEGKQKLLQTLQKYDTIVFENKRLRSELNEGQEKLLDINDKYTEIKQQLKVSQENYEMLKVACSITDNQLSEVEDMLDAEVKRNQTNQNKIDELWKKIRQKDDLVAKLKEDNNKELSAKKLAETKNNDLQIELNEIKNNFNQISEQLIKQQKQLIEETENLLNAQEKIEVLTTDTTNLQAQNKNYESELNILKEENSKILTDLFISREESSNRLRELNDTKQIIEDLGQEIEQLKDTLSETKTYYLQRDIKAEATLAQHKKLIDYLQLKVEDLSQKKKKSLTDKIFGTGGGTLNLKKENLCPNQIESTIIYRTLQEELKREKQRCERLKEQLLKAKTDLRKIENENKIDDKNDVIKDKTIEVKEINQTKNDLIGSQLSLRKNHHFEMTLENDSTTSIICNVCIKEILSGHSYWKCKECNCSVHRKCRSGIQNSCEAIIINDDTISKQSETVSITTYQQDDNESVSGCTSGTTYKGKLILQSNMLPLSNSEINCVYEISQFIILLGCNNGLFAYHRNTKDFIQIFGIECVNNFAITEALSKAIIIGSNGELLYQCCLRHLKSRCQTLACLKPKLETSVLDLPFANRAHNEKWQMVKISDEIENIIEAVAIAVTTSRIVIMKYDFKMQRFKPVRALDTATIVSSILFTKHTAIVTSDKYFEIDLSSFSAEEFIDISDKSMLLTLNSQPMAAFLISQQEFLLCFMEFGIFVDQYGCRSRPYNISWNYTPTGFVYREPFLYISHFQIVQIIRIHRSFTKENLRKLNDDDDEPNLQRTILNMYMPNIISECGKLNVYVLSINKSSNKQELYTLDGLKAFKSNTNESLETLTSIATCVTAETLSEAETSSS